MELTIPIIFDSLAQFHPQLWGEGKKNQEIFNMKFLNESTAKLDDRYLYLTDNQGVLDTTQDDLPKNVLFVGQIDQLLLKDTETCIISLDCRANVLEIFEFVQKIFEEYKKWNRKIIESILRNEPLQIILDLAAAKLTNPIALNDSALTLIHKSGEFKNNYAGTMWEGVITSSYTPLDFYSARELEEISRHAAENSSPFLFQPARAGGHTHLYTALMVNNKPYGSLGMVDINEPFTQGQIDIVSHLKTMIEFALQRSAEFIPETEESTSYINRLLSGFSIEEKIVNNHLSQRGWTVLDNYYLLNFSYPVSNDSLLTNSLIQKISRSFPKALLLSFEYSIITLVRKADYAILEDALQKELEKLLREHDLKCGLSTEFYSFLDLKDYYLQSKYALSEGLTQNHEDVIFYYVDYYKKHISIFSKIQPA